MKALIEDRQTVAEGVVAVRLGGLEEDINFKPGQFIFITLADPPYSDNRGNRRHFSIVSSPRQKRMIVITTKVGKSAFKRSLIELPLNTAVELGPIGGNFVLPENVSQPLVFIAGGIGITPFMSMLRFTVEAGFKYRIALFHSNRDQKSTPFFDELNGLARKQTNFKYIPIMTRDENWRGEKRHIDGKLLQEYLKDLKGYRYLLAGPPALVGAVDEALKKTDIPEANIRAENFTGY